MNDLTQAWMEEEALHGDEELVVVVRCDWAGHGECDGALYCLKGSTAMALCKRHLLLQATYHEMWGQGQTNKTFTAWLDTLENDTARIMYESNQESVCMDYWEEI